MNQAESLTDRELNSEFSLLIRRLQVGNWWRRRPPNRLSIALFLLCLIDHLFRECPQCCPHSNDSYCSSWVLLDRTWLQGSISQRNREDEREIGLGQLSRWRKQTPSRHSSSRHARYDTTKEPGTGTKQKHARTFNDIPAKCRGTLDTDAPTVLRVRDLQ